MNRDDDQPDVPSLDEDLVAYLDGELEDQASRRLEERLANDETARQRLRALATSWDLLDYLPRSAMDDTFTRTTVQIVALAAAEDVAREQASLPLRKRRRWIAGAVAALAAAMVGFVAIVVAWPDPNTLLLRDLPVVKNFELYEVTPSIDFLRQLDKEGIFLAEMTEPSHEEAKTEASDVATASRDELSERRAEVEAMPAEKKDELRKLYERFKARPDAEKERLRQLDAALRDDPEETRLRGVLERYHNWLPTLSPLERADLLKLAITDSSAAIAQIQKLKKEESRNLATRLATKVANVRLTKDDFDTIENWLQDRVWNDKDEILSKATEKQQQWFEGLPADKQKRSLVLLAMGQPRPPKPADPDKQEWQELLNLLSPAVKDAVTKAGTPEAQQKLLFDWHRTSMWARDAIGGGVSREELERFFKEELNDEERKKLSELPPALFHRRLQRDYFVKKEAPPDWEPWKNFGRGRGREGGPRRPDGGARGQFDGNRRGPPPEHDRGPGGPREERPDRGDLRDHDREAPPDRSREPPSR